MRVHALHTALTSTDSTSIPVYRVPVRLFILAVVLIFRPGCRQLLVGSVAVKMLKAENPAHLWLSKIIQEDRNVAKDGVT